MAPKAKRLLQCHLCHKNYSRRSSLLRHLQVHAASNEFHCSNCDKMNASRGICDEHLRCLKPEEAKIFACGDCGKQFARQDMLKRHVLIHEISKHYKCAYCSKEFNRKDNLRRHEQKHEKPALPTCQKCSKQFLESETLAAHFKMCVGPALSPPSIFTQTFETPNSNDQNFVRMAEELQCPICFVRLCSKSNLRRHLKLHNRPKQFLCQLCGNDWSSEDKYNNHHCASDNSLNLNMTKSCVKQTREIKNFNRSKIKPEVIRAT